MEEEDYNRYFTQEEGEEEVKYYMVSIKDDKDSLFLYIDQYEIV